jgi:hypothetical protein
MPFRFTLFNGLVGLIMALTVWLIVLRFTRKLDSNWPLVYYAVLLAFWKVFDGSFNTWWVLAGVLCGLLLRFEFLGATVVKVVRWCELAVCGYVLWRSVGLWLLW